MVEFEESATDPIVGISALTRRPGGGYVLTDQASARAQLFDHEGRLERTLGRRGAGPGELEDPTSAIEWTDGRVFVTQRANPRLTVFGEAGPNLARVPGFYASWIAPLGASLVVQVGAHEERLGVLSLDGEVQATFGRLDPSINETPFWIYFAREHAAVVDGEVVTNTSFFPTLKAFSSNGDSLRAFGSPPPSWVSPTTPPISEISMPGDRERIEAWAGSFTVVRHVAGVSDSLVVVQYGRHRPTRGDPYSVDPTSIDVYDLAGTKIVEDVPFVGRIIGGSGELFVLSNEPPAPWTVSVYRWKGP